MTTPNTCPFAVSIVTDEAELAKARAQRQRFMKNWHWFEEHVNEIYDAHRGKIICVAGQEVFAAETAKEARMLAHEAHPNDDGLFTRIIPKERMPRIYAD